MKKVFSVIAKFIFIVFIVAVFLWTASLTLSEIRAILPNDPITPYFALALFDGGAIAWLGAWLYHARGIYQRAISLTLMVVDLLGVILLSAGRLLGGGQTMTEAPENLGVTVVYGVVIATLVNLAAIYFFHTTDPDTIEEIETSILEDTLRDEALTQAKASIESEAQTLGAILAARATGRLKYRLQLPMGEHEVKAIETIDLAQENKAIATSVTRCPKCGDTLFADGFCRTCERVTATPQTLVIPHPTKTRKVNPLVMFFAKTAHNLKQRMSGAVAQSVVTYESAAGNVLDDIETPSQQPAETPSEAQSEPAEKNPTPQA